MEWINVDRLPPQTGAYLITNGRMIWEGYWSPANGWEIDRDSRLCGFMDAQFWTHFPELPKERHNDWNRELSLSDGLTVTERLPGTPVQYIGQCTVNGITSAPDTSAGAWPSPRPRRLPQALRRPW